MVGIANTLLHFAVLAGLVTVAKWPVWAANLLAFLAATGFGFWINAKWTFRQVPKKKTYLGFVCMMAVLAVSGGWLTDFFQLHSAFALVMTATGSWLLGFLGSNFLIFRQK
ncbi:GtrA family protein [Neisseria chenwenguii]|nr:GtrA family protein [Neisseria chenwenguii]